MSNNAALQEEFYRAIHENDKAKFINLVRTKRANINKPTREGYTPLMIAVTYNNVELAESLLEAGADVNKGLHGDNYYTALFIAVQNNYIDMVKLLIRYKANINKGNPFFVACENGFTEIVQLFINADVDIHKTGFNQSTPLHIACRNGYGDIVQLLLDAGADTDVNKEAAEKYTPLHLAASVGQDEIVRLLIDHGAEVNSKNNRNETPLFMASIDNHVEVVYVLIQNGANVNIQDNNGVSPLQLASQEGYEDIVGLLLQAGADVNIANTFGETPLFFAAWNGHDRVVDMLLDKSPVLTGVLEEGIQTKFPRRIGSVLASYYNIPYNPTLEENNNAVNNNNNNAARGEKHEINMNINGMRYNYAFPTKALEPSELRSKTAFNIMEFSNVAIPELMGNRDALVFKYKESYFTVPRSYIEDGITSRENIRFECERESGGAPLIEDIKRTPYYYIRATGNFLVELNALKNAMNSRSNIIELLDTNKVLNNVASYLSVVRERGLGIDGRPVNIVSADHCQKGTKQKVYGIRIIFENTEFGGGKRTLRKSKRRATRKMKHKKRSNKTSKRSK